jgi:cobalt-zinc-cadmium efflux system protein
MSQQQRLGIVLALNVAMVAGLTTVGLTAHSLGVLAAGVDYLADAAAILLGIVAVSMRDRAGPQSRAPTVVALLNGGALLVISVLVTVDAVRRLLTGTPEVHGLPVLIVSAVAAVVMSVATAVLGRGAGSEDLHMRSVWLDTFADAMASAAVAVTGAVIFLVHGWYWLDSVVAVLIGSVVGAGAVRLLRDVVRALRTGAAEAGLGGGGLGRTG